MRATWTNTSIIALAGLALTLTGCPDDAESTDCPAGQVYIAGVCVDSGDTGGGTDTVGTDTGGTDTGGADTGGTDTGGTDTGGGVTLPFALDDYYAPSGYFPAGQATNIVPGACPSRAGDMVGVCHGFTWTPAGSDGFAGVWWQYPDGNWGGVDGAPGLDVPEGASAITFWAWGAAGGEKVTFGSGYASDGFEKNTGELTLTTTPTEYTISLAGATYANGIAGGFSWVSTSSGPAVTLYIDDIEFQAPAAGAGCTDSNANNYDATATVDDGSCTYDTVQLPFAIDDYYAPSGFFPEGQATAIAADGTCPQRAGDMVGDCHAFTWTPVGSDGFAGVWWQYPDGNWGGDGSDPGLEIAAGAHAITFWAWGANGGEVLKFGSGYASDGFERNTGDLTLTTTPTEYTIDLVNTTYTDIAGGFSWVAVSGGAAVTFYVDDIEMQGPPAGGGCTDPNANNYDANATADDGSCTYDQVSLPITIDDYYSPSGFFPGGQADAIAADGTCPQRAGDMEGDCHAFTWTPVGSDGFAGVFWQFPEGNWGDTGTPGLPIEAGATDLTFWAWTAAGGETVRFFAGYASDGGEVTTGDLTLTTTPTEYTIDLSSTSYTTLAAGFGWVATTGLTLYIDDIVMSKAPVVVGSGCTDSDAANYDSTANTDDGSCTYNVTFSVDMSDETLAGSDVVYLSGNFQAAAGTPPDWCGGCTPLTKGAADVWSVTVAIPTGSWDYKYQLNQWVGQETVPAACGVVNAENNTNRRVEVVDAPVSPALHEWSACAGPVVTVMGCTDSDASNYDAGANTDDGSCTYTVTFSVDMSDETLVGTDVVFVSGNFQDEVGTDAEWCGGCTPLTKGADDVWSTTVDLPPGTYEYKYQLNEWTSDESVPEACGVTDGGFTNRPLVIVAAPVTPKVHKWGACPEAPPAGTGLVFGDDYAAGVTFTEFGGSVNTLTVDTGEFQSGSASLKVAVGAGDYTGGTFLAATPQDLSAFNAVTFWVKASVAGKTLNVVGLGNDAAAKPLEAERTALPLTTTWTRHAIPIPDPAKLTANAGLFHYAEGSDQGSYTIWFDEIAYEAVDTLTNPQPAIPSLTLAKGVGEMVNAPVGSLGITINGTAVSLGPVGGGYFDLASNNTSVATVSGSVATTVGPGMAMLTATLAGTAATGSISLTVSAAGTGPATNAPTPPSRDAADVVSIFSGAYTNVPAPNWVFEGEAPVAAAVTQTTAGGDDVLKYTDLVWVAAHLDSTVDVSAMTHVHVDVYFEDPPGTDEQLNFQVYDFGADGAFGTGGDDTHGELVMHQSGDPYPTVLTPGVWQSFNFPLADFDPGNTGSGGLKARANVGRLVFVALNDTTNTTKATIWVDNLYFYK